MVLKVSFPPGPTLALIFGFRDENLKELESSFGVRAVARGNQVVLTGPRPAVEAAAACLEKARESRSALSPETIRARSRGVPDDALSVETPRQRIVPRGPRQEAYVKAIRESDVVLGVGPAGTGKTYLAVGCAIASMVARRVERIILARPVVEAGERLGFLPGDIQEKVNPYMRPLHDALKDMLEGAALRRFLDEEIIEIAPLAYMRGRTLNNAFVILDEAQNTTIEQMKMFLTRLGTGSRAVVTGDVTQVDLPPHVTSGLVHAAGILKGVPGTEVVRFLPADVVRHPLVQRILEKYEKASGRGRRTA